MNVINKGDFAITNFQDRTTMSFKIPSKQKMDFVAGLRNSQQSFNRRCQIEMTLVLAEAAKRISIVVP